MDQAQVQDLMAVLAEELRNRLEIAPTRHVKIQKFTPNQDIQVWLTAFDQRCKTEGIDVDHRKQELLANLDLSTAFASVQRMNLPENLDYEEFKERIAERFGRTGSPAEFREEFRGRMQGTNESVEAYSDSLIELAARAFPNMTMEQREDELVEQYIKGAKISADMREKLIFAQPANLQELKRMLRRLEAAWSMTHKGAGVRITRNGEEEEESLRATIVKQKEEIERQQKLLQELTSKMAEKQYVPRKPYIVKHRLLDAKFV